MFEFVKQHDDVGYFDWVMIHFYGMLGTTCCGLMVTMVLIASGFRRGMDWCMVKHDSYGGDEFLEWSKGSD